MEPLVYAKTCSSSQASVTNEPPPRGPRPASLDHTTWPVRFSIAEILPLSPKNIRSSTVMDLDEIESGGTGGGLTFILCGACNCVRKLSIRRCRSKLER